MDATDSQGARAGTLIAALLYLMTHYARTGCPRLAMCISRHLQILGAHPEADPVVRDICAGLHGAWTEGAAGGASGARVH